MTDLLIVGAGLFGLTIAEQAANRLGLNVQVIDRRKQIGGNAFSSIDPETGIEVHHYGSHLFHTSNQQVWEYVNQFTHFSNYKHVVFANFEGEIYSLPINLGTINQFFRAAYSPKEAKELLQSQISDVITKVPSNLEEQAISLIGKPLYEAFIKGYTQKQWQTPPAELSPEIIRRLPVRFNYDNKYFQDIHEGLPIDGYSAWFEKMVENPLIKISLETDFFDSTQPFNKDDCVNQIPVVYTGPIDRYFEWVYGSLGWRTLDFEVEKLDVDDFQGTSVMNYSEVEVPFTRIHEFKHFHPEKEYLPNKTIIMKEFSRFANQEDEPYYPINSLQDRETLEKYRKLAKAKKGVLFGGRLGSYQYLDMHMAIASALNRFETVVKPWFS